MDANKSIFDISISKLPNMLHKTKIIKILTNTKNISKLADIMTKYGSDKGSGLSQDFILYNKRPPNLVCHNYTFFYELLFEKYINDSINIFEMGIGVPLCMGSLAGSLKGWAEYFPNSTIYSADIDKENLYSNDRITSMILSIRSSTRLTVFSVILSGSSESINRPTVVKNSS